MLNKLIVCLIFGSVSSMALVTTVQGGDSASHQPSSWLVPVVGPRGVWSVRIATVDASGAEQAVTPTLDNALLKLIRSVREVKAVGEGFSDSGRTFFVLATSMASKADVSHGAGFCGAGSEQSLWLLELNVRRGVLKLSDALLVQSCMRSLSLVGDSDLKLGEWSGVISDPRSFDLQWLDHPDFGGYRKHILIRGGRWLIQ